MYKFLIQIFEIDFEIFVCLCSRSKIATTAVCEKTNLGFFLKNTKNSFQTTSQFCIFKDETQTRYSKGSDQF